MNINLTFSQSSGIITDDYGTYVAMGWAGNHAGKCNPKMQDIHNVGPLPAGLYKIGPWEEHHDHLGPFVASLTQISGETYGRDSFYIHGPDKDPKNFGQESKGCIVVPRPGRENIKKTGATHITVRA